MLRIHTFALLAVALTGPQLSAQLTQLPNTGCGDGTTAVNPIVAANGSSPTIGNLLFRMEHTCPSGGPLAIAVFGLCSTGSPVNWDLSMPCFRSWTNPPASCGMGVSTVTFLDGGLTSPAGVFEIRFPMLPFPELRSWMQAQPLCLQVICIDVTGSNAFIDCRSVSAGAQLIAL